MLELLANGHPVDDIAATLGRSVTAISSRCRLLLPEGERSSRDSADLQLRSLLDTDPDYDWRSLLRAEHARQGRFYWDRAADEKLRDGWHRVRPMDTLVTTLGASEIEIARRLVELGLAATTVDVVATVGCQPEGTLDVRIRIATDRAITAVWILIADGLQGTARARELDQAEAPKAYRHVSLHAHRRDAEQTLDQLLAEHLDRGGHRETVTVTFAQRTVGDLDTGETHHQHAPDAHRPNAH